MYSAVYHALNLLCFNLHRYDSNQYQHHSTVRKGKLKLLLAPPGSKCSNNLPTRLSSGLSSYFLCQECSPTSLQTCVLLLQVSPQIAPILTNFKVAYTSYSILNFFQRRQMICIHLLVLKNRDTLTYYYCILSAQHRRRYWLNE